MRNLSLSPFAFALAVVLALVALMPIHAWQTSPGMHDATGGTTSSYDTTTNDSTGYPTLVINDPSSPSGTYTTPAAMPTPPDTGMGTTTEMTSGSDYLVGDSPVRSSQPDHGAGCTPDVPVMGPPLFPTPECHVIQTGVNPDGGNPIGYWGVQSGDCNCTDAVVVEEFPCPFPGQCDRSSNGGACPTCGAGFAKSLPSAGSHDTSAQVVSRAWLPNNRVSHSSLSPGHFTHFDSHLEIFPETGGDAISFYDAFAKRVFVTVDGLDGDPRDGVFHDLRNAHIKELKLLDAAGVVTTSVSSATSAEVLHRNGFKESFELFNSSTSTTEPQLVGRLSHREDRQGNFVAVSYRDWTPTELASAPDRQWQIETIVDAQGHTLDFTYNATQVGGRWVVESITRDDGRAITYDYDSLNLTSVTYPDGSSTSLTYGQDAEAQTATATITSALNGTELTYHLTNDYMTLSEAEQQLVINQPTGVMRKVELPSQEVQWMYVPNTDPSVSEDFIYTGANTATISYGDGTYQDYIDWAVAQMEADSSTDAWDSITGTLESAYYGAPEDLTTSQLYTGQWP